MSSTKSIIQEIKQIDKKIQRIKEHKQALKSSLLSEGLVKMLVDLILGPFIHIDARKLAKSKEYKDAMKKIKELEELQKKLEKRKDDLDAENEKLQKANMKKYGKKYYEYT
jgi:hypothetical protein